MLKIGLFVRVQPIKSQSSRNGNVGSKPEACGQAVLMTSIWGSNWWNTLQLWFPTSVARNFEQFSSSVIWIYDLFVYHTDM